MASGITNYVLRRSRNSDSGPYLSPTWNEVGEKPVKHGPEMPFHVSGEVRESVFPMTLVLGIEQERLVEIGPQHDRALFQGNR